MRHEGKDLFSFQVRTCGVGHGDGGPDFIVDRIELGQHDPVYQPRMLHRGIIRKRSVDVEIKV